MYIGGLFILQLMYLFTSSRCKNTVQMLLTVFPGMYKDRYTWNIEIGSKLTRFRCINYDGDDPKSFPLQGSGASLLRNPSSGGFRGGAPWRLPYGPNFSQFHAVFRKIWQNHMLAPPWRVGAPSYGESWVRPCLEPPLIIN